MATVNIFATDSGTGTESPSIGETSIKPVIEIAATTETVTVTKNTNSVWQYPYYDPFSIQGARDPANNANISHPSAWLKNSPTQDWED